MSSTTGSKHRDLTPYAAAKVATRKFRAWGLIGPEDEISSQSFYSNKSIKRTDAAKKADGGPGLMFDGDSFNEYLENSRHGIVKATRQNYDKLADEYADDAELAAQEIGDEPVETDEGDEGDEPESTDEDEDAEVNALASETDSA